MVLGTPQYGGWPNIPWQGWNFKRGTARFVPNLPRRMSPQTAQSKADSRAIVALSFRGGEPVIETLSSSLAEDEVERVMEHMIVLNGNRTNIPQIVCEPK